MNQNAQTASAAFLALGILFIGFIHNRSNFAAPFFCLIIELELIVNLVLSLNNLAYQNNADYQNFVQNTKQVTQYAKDHDDRLYRMEKRSIAPTMIHSVQITTASALLILFLTNAF